jgi:xanthine dehydrogenase YagS FAD-binding subunit
MRPVSYTRVADVGAAVEAVRAHPAGEFLAGGTTEVDLLRAGVARAELLVDIQDLPLSQVDDRPDGGLRIGATARMSDVARHPSVVARYPGLSQALLLGASEQLRNMATMGGNLCQRVRCSYFRDGVSACNKRDPGTGCSALDGLNRGHAILGTSEHCIATHPSDAAVALVAFDAVVQTIGPSGARSLPIKDFYLPPGSTPQRDHPLEHGELIVAIDLPPLSLARRSVYLKFRDRESYEFALVSVLAAVGTTGDQVTAVRLALGGVATRPWRASRAEARLLGNPADPATFAAAAADELSVAQPRQHNGFKIPLASRAMVRALVQATRTGMDGEVP